jgi:hypothetical protein
MPLRPARRAYQSKITEDGLYLEDDASRDGEAIDIEADFVWEIQKLDSSAAGGWGRGWHIFRAFRAEKGCL